jgi:bifunctional enzyme CysN/CysC/sulfate adenylyltransferase subunit 1
MRIAPFRMPVQWVNRPNLDFRGFSGFIGGGNIRPGDIVRILPAGRDTRVSRIVTYDGDLDSAVSGQSVTITLAEEIDCSRGDLLCSPVSPAKAGDRLEAQLLWLVREPLVAGKNYLLKIGAKTTPASVTTVDSRIQIESGLAAPLPQGETLAFNEIGEAKLALETVVACDPYVENRETGGFILIDRITNETVAVGMVKTVASSDRRVEAPLVDLSYASMEGLPTERDSFRPSRRRSLAKAFSWLAPASVATFLILYAFIGDAALTAQITGLEMVAIFALYYFHERFWTRYSYGLESPEPPPNDPGL